MLEHSSSSDTSSPVSRFSDLSTSPPRLNGDTLALLESFWNERSIVEEKIKALELSTHLVDGMMADGEELHSNDTSRVNITVDEFESCLV